MDTLPFRQLHLDFHTGEDMPDVGKEFSEADFEKALIEGHINSVTLFSKCHHGWSYHPTTVNKTHPTLNTNLLARQIAVCEKLGVRTQIYISAGLDERMVNLHQEYMAHCANQHNTLLGAKFHPICLNNDEYLAVLVDETVEIFEMFKGHFDGLFYDICTPPPCVCSNCIDSMIKLGLNPENPDDVENHRKVVYEKFTTLINNTVAKYDKDMAVFYNCGNVPRDDRSVAYSNTKHLELESLPTGGWGYDHFPMSAAYARVLGKEFLGMTGKFHKAWGEFGGYKHPNALLYETSLSIANGAKCSIGDQLHPLGKFDEATYKLIGKAYEEVEKKEEWCHDVTGVIDVAIYTTYTDATRNSCPDIGANRMMLEGKYLYNIIDKECDFSDYKLIIFPDCVKFDRELIEKTNAYIETGGKILLSGKSGLTESNEFFRDFGVIFCGENPIDDTYLIPTYDMQPNGKAAYLMYAHGYNISADEGVKIFAHMQNSYFNRSLRHFCSHSTTPNDPSSQGVGALVSENIAYIAWDIFTEYGMNGAYQHKRIVCDILDYLLEDKKTLETNLGSNGIVTLMEQKNESRYVNHLLYAVTKLRGTVEVIEDAPEIVNVTVSVRMPCPPKRVYIAPDNKDITFNYKDGVLTYNVNSFVLHAMVVIDK